jgi:hypothetical protein
MLFHVRLTHSLENCWARDEYEGKGGSCRLKRTTSPIQERPTLGMKTAYRQSPTASTFEPVTVTATDKATERPR